MMRSAVVAGMLLALGLSGTAEGLDSYQSDLTLDWEKMELAPGNDMSMTQVSYRWYFAGVDAMEGPYELQPFKQRASWAEVGYGFGGDDAGNDGKGFGIDARYVIPETVVGIDLSYMSMDLNDNDWLNDLRLGAVIWLNDDSNLAIEAGFAFGEMFGTDMTTIDVGARCIVPIEDHHLEITGRYTNTSYDATGVDDDSGILVETRFFFNKEVFAGLSFSTVNDDSTYTLSGGYSHESGLHAGLYIGKDDDDGVFGLDVGFRF